MNAVNQISSAAQAWERVPYIPLILAMNVVGDKISKACVMGEMFFKKQAF